MRLLLIILGILVILLVFLCRLRLGILAAFAAGRRHAGPPDRPRLHPSLSASAGRGEKKMEEDSSQKPKKADQSKGSRGESWQSPPGLTCRTPGRLCGPRPAGAERTRRGIRIDPLNLRHGRRSGGPGAGRRDLRDSGDGSLDGDAASGAVSGGIPDPHIHVGVDFDAGKNRVDGTAAVTIRLGTLLAVALGAGFPCCAG